MKSTLHYWGRVVFPVTFAVVVGVMSSVALVFGATTISTNVSTGGTLSVTGLTTLGQASSTRFSVHGTAYFGGTATTTINSAGNVSVAGTLGVTGASTLSSTLAVTSTTTMSGNLVVTHSNTATSTIQVGCMNTYATSTASPVKLMFFASSTLNIDGASVTAGFGGGTLQGLVLWGFGNCPLI